MWQDLLDKSEVPEAAPTTAARAFQREGLNVRYRVAREKPQRTDEHIQERYAVATRWRYLPKDFFLNTVDLIMDNKIWDYPSTQVLLLHRG